MEYCKIIPAQFIARPNRFVARVKLQGIEYDVHVKNTGRCRELLVPGATVYLEEFSSRMGKRRLRYDLVAVEKESLLVNIDSQAPNTVVKEALHDGAIRLPGMDGALTIKPEIIRGNSRFDFYVRDFAGREGFVEVKGVTLENGGVASFPDAPTERGIKHVQELVREKERGSFAYVVFVIQMAGMTVFTPNDACHAAFGEALRYAAANGVEILAYACNVTPNSLQIADPVPVIL